MNWYLFGRIIGYSFLISLILLGLTSIVSVIYIVYLKDKKREQHGSEFILQTYELPDPILGGSEEVGNAVDKDDISETGR